MQECRTYRGQENGRQYKDYEKTMTSVVVFFYTLTDGLNRAKRGTVDNISIKGFKGRF